jgi:serine/threonine protein kinase
LDHPNIVRLFQVFNRRSNVNLVLEHMTTDLEILLNEQSIVLGLGDIKAYMYYRMLSGISCLDSFILVSQAHDRQGNALLSRSLDSAPRLKTFQLFDRRERNAQTQ